MSWLSYSPDGTEMQDSSPSGSRKPKGKKKRQNSELPTSEDLSQIATLVSQEARSRDGDDTTMIVVYLRPVSPQQQRDFTGEDGDELVVTVCGSNMAQ